MSFNFESKYFKNKNKLENEKHAAEVSKELDKDLTVLLEGVADKLANPEFFDEDTTAKLHREDLLQRLRARLETEDDLSQLSQEHHAAVVAWAQVITVTGEESAFHTENDFDEPISVEDELGISEPYKIISQLIDDLCLRFRETFWSELDILDIIPRDIFLTSAGEIQSADLDVNINRDKMSVKFNDLFPKSDTFYIVYDRSRERPHNHFYLQGIIKPNTFEKVVELDDTEGAV